MSDGGSSAQRLGDGWDGLRGTTRPLDKYLMGASLSQALSVPGAVKHDGCELNPLGLRGEMGFSGISPQTHPRGMVSLLADSLRPEGVLQCLGWV